MTPADALQAWLALEHEAVWFYPVVGARLDGLRGRATTSFEAHRDTRDDLLARLRDLDIEPVVAALAYEVGPITTAAEARTVAQRIESQISAACLSLVGLVDGDTRTFAVAALTATAVAELTWGAEPKAFPGLP